MGYRGSFQHASSGRFETEFAANNAAALGYDELKFPRYAEIQVMNYWVPGLIEFIVQTGTSGASGLAPWFCARFQPVRLGGVTEEIGLGDFDVRTRQILLAPTMH